MTDLGRTAAEPVRADCPLRSNDGSCFSRDSLFSTLLPWDRMAEEIGRGEKVELILEFRRKVVQASLLVIEFESLFDETFESRFLVKAKTFVSVLLFVGESKMEMVEFLFPAFALFLLAGAGLAGRCRPFPFSGEQVGMRGCHRFWPGNLLGTDAAGRSPSARVCRIRASLDVQHCKLSVHFCFWFFLAQDAGLEALRMNGGRQFRGPMRFCSWWKGGKTFVPIGG